jgi:polysaccharide export outer membrane protein
MRYLITAIVLSLFFISCKTPNRAIYNYLEDIKDTSARGEIVIKEPVIQKNDLLSIQVYSAATDPLIDAPYNMPAMVGGAGASQTGQIGGVLVDQKGNIDFPRVGAIHAEGLSKSELADIIKDKLKGQLTDPSVIIRFLNFRITVMGEVGNPGVLNIPTERLTLLEALGMAGDITEFGKKKEVKILREYNGVRKMGILDVTTEKMFESPYYQLQQNDVILVEQTRYKIRQTEQQRITQQIGFATGIITTAALLITLFKR